MTNHVPDEALAAIDGLGEGLLVGDPRPVAVRLRSDLGLCVPCTEAAIRAGAVPVEFHIEHGHGRETLRGHGSFVGTIVDGIDDRFREWGIEPPAAYEHRGRRSDGFRYGGMLRF